MYYMRKLSKITTLSKIKNVEKIEDIPADILKQELATTQNALSFWKCESLDNTKDSMKAILLSTTSIEKSRFIIFDDEILSKYNIKYDESEAGKTGYKGYEALHVNFCDLTLGKLFSIVSMIKEIQEQDIRIPELSKENVKEYIKEVCEADLLNEENVNEHLMNDIKKYNLLKT